MRPGRRGALAWGAAALLAPWPARAQGAAAVQAVQPVPWQAGLDAWLDGQRRAWGVPGLAVALLHGGQPVYTKGFGTRDAAQRLPVTPQTLFRGGSTTKALGAASIALLVDEGRLAWDAPVTTWLPELRLAGGDGYASLSLRDMLAHRSGLPRHDLLWYNNQTLTRQGLVARMPHLAMTAPLRQRYQYTNLMVILAGHALERASGQSWEVFTRERLLQPLGLPRAVLSATEMQRDADHAVGFTTVSSATATSGAAGQAHTASQQRLEPVPLRDDPLLGPAGALNAGITDFAAWAQFQLAQGQWRGRRLLSTAAFAAMWEPLKLASTTPAAPDFSRSHVGLGWRIDRWRDAVRVAHGGDLNGFTSRVVLLPEKNAAVVVLVNHGSHPLPNALVPDLLDHLLGLPHADAAGRALARTRAAEDARAQRALAAATADLRAAQRAASAPAVQEPAWPADAAGLYRHPGYGDLRVVQADRGLAVAYNGMQATLQHRLLPAARGAPDAYAGAGAFDTRTARPEHGDFDGQAMDFLPAAAGRPARMVAPLQVGVPPIEFVRVD